MPVNLMETHHDLLKDFWSVQDSFRGEHRQQFQNAFIGALSLLTDGLAWKAAIASARIVVVRNVKAHVVRTEPDAQRMDETHEQFTERTGR